MDGAYLNQEAREQVQEMLASLSKDTKGQDELESISERYKTYKDTFARNLKFDPTLKNLSRTLILLDQFDFNPHFF